VISVPLGLLSLFRFAGSYKYKKHVRSNIAKEKIKIKIAMGKNYLSNKSPNT
jgi:hypothetical protein